MKTKRREKDIIEVKKTGRCVDVEVSDDCVGRKYVGLYVDSGVYYFENKIEEILCAGVDCGLYVL